MTLFAGIEAGGTKFNCAVATAEGKLLHERRFATRNPDPTLADVIEFLQAVHHNTPLTAIGIAAFGPVDVEPASKHYGYITSTPKLAWRFFNLRGALVKAFGLPVGFDTDVNGAALGEHLWGQGQGLDTFVYITVGTGIGGGAILGNQLAHGLVHPEMGHLFIPQDKNQDPYPGICPYHGNCLEGLASGPAIKDRWQVKSALDLPADHPAWPLEAHYLAFAVANYIMTLSPKRIIMGGGVMAQQQLFPLIRTKVLEHLNGYIDHPSLLQAIDEYIVAPGLGSKSGVYGAIALAKQAYSASSNLPA